jgi:hypothetical protein
MCFYFICNRPDQTRMLTFVPTSFDQRLFLINFHEKFDFVGIESPLEIFTITCPSHWTLYHNAFIYVSTSYYTISVETLSILHNILHFLLRQNSKSRLNTLKKKIAIPGTKIANCQNGALHVSFTLNGYRIKWKGNKEQTINDV